eukprot:g6463.t1
MRAASAPAREWNRIEREVVGKLQAFGLGEDATPMQSFESLHQYLMYFRNLVPTSLISIREEIDNFVQDINCGNLLTSEVDKVSNSWRLDAVIDWESAVIAPGELLCRPLEDHWRIAMAFGQVAKGAWLAGCLAEKALPRCDLECFTGDDAEAVCTKVPSGPVEAAGFVGWAQDLVSDVIGYDITWESLQSAASVSMAPFCLLSVCCLAKCFVCPRSKPERSRLFFYVLSVVTVLPGLGICAAGGYAFFTVEFMAGVLALGFAVVFIAGLGIYAVYTGDRGKQMCFSVLHTLEVLTLLGTVFMSAKFAMDLDKMTSDTLSQAGAAPTGLTSAGVAQRMADQVMKRLLSLSCRTYQVCCEDTELLDLRVANGAPRQCKVAHEGMADDAGFVLSDPSHPNFCQAVSGRRRGAEGGRALQHEKALVENYTRAAKNVKRPIEAAADMESDVVHHCSIFSLVYFASLLYSKDRRANPELTVVAMLVILGSITFAAVS